MSNKIAALYGQGEADGVIAELPITEFPVDPIKLAEDHGITVRPKESSTPGVSGFLMKVGDVFGIMYATHIHNQGFIHFTVAHEFGHYFIPGHPEQLFANGKTLHASKSGFISSEKCEVEADHFAATLLMPPKLFADAARRVPRGFAGVQKLSEMFGTSLTATAIQYAKQTDDLVAVIVSDGTSINYCFLSDTLSNVRGMSRYQKGSVVSPRSETARFAKDAGNIRLAKQASAWTTLSNWFEDAPDADFKEDVVGLGSYGKTLTILFSDELVEEDDDDDHDDD